MCELRYIAHSSENNTLEGERAFGNCANKARQATSLWSMSLSDNSFTNIGLNPFIFKSFFLCGHALLTVVFEVHLLFCEWMSLETAQLIERRQYTFPLTFSYIHYAACLRHCLKQKHVSPNQAELLYEVGPCQSDL
jgi:hypothetical protein